MGNGGCGLLGSRGMKKVVAVNPQSNKIYDLNERILFSLPQSTNSGDRQEEGEDRAGLFEFFFFFLIILLIKNYIFKRKKKKRNVEVILYGNVCFGLCKIKHLTPIDIILKINYIDSYSKRIFTTIFPFIRDDTIIDKTILLSFSLNKNSYKNDSNKLPILLGKKIT